MKYGLGMAAVLFGTLFTATIPQVAVACDARQVLLQKGHFSGQWKHRSGDTGPVDLVFKKAANGKLLIRGRSSDEHGKRTPWADYRPTLQGNVITFQTKRSGTVRLTLRNCRELQGNQTGRINVRMSLQ